LLALLVVTALKQLGREGSRNKRGALRTTIARQEGVLLRLLAGKNCRQNKERATRATAGEVSGDIMVPM
jgi:hypothetical protein